MRNVFLVAIVGSLIALGQSRRVVENPELQAAKKPVELWMGRALVIVDEASAQPEGRTRISEARITADSIGVSMSQIRAFQSSQELAEFLAHAAAHARLGHLTTVAEPRGRAEMEKEAEAVAAELMESSGCAPAGSCGMFGLLLRAARRP